MPSIAPPIVTRPCIMEALVAEERFAVGADPDRFPPMDDLSARLESLLRRFDATACDQAQGDEALAEQFRMELQSLVSEYGPEALNSALDAMPDERSTSVSPH